MKKALFLILTIGFLFGCETKNKIKNKIYEEAVEQINAQLPMEVQEGISMDKIEFADKEFKYFITFTTKQPTTPSDEFIKGSKPSLADFVKNQSELKLFRDDNVTFDFIYRTNDGNIYADIKITPEDYK